MTPERRWPQQSQGRYPPLTLFFPPSCRPLLPGFSVDSAMDVMSLGELTFVAGAPRANHTGAVVLLRKDNVYRLVPQHIFWGEELASSFGYSVATTDLNKDGWEKRLSTWFSKNMQERFLNFTFASLPSWTDLIIGAPNFFDRKAEIGGAVYVYLNPFGHWDDQARPIRLNGTYDSMFGMTVSSVGDLDQDGYGGDFFRSSAWKKKITHLLFINHVKHV